VPKKNVRKLVGKPMIEYSIEVGLKCPYINTLMVTTDSEEIKQVAKKAGAEVPFIRPDIIATDTSRQEDAVLHAMDWYEINKKKFDLICLLQPTEPLRRVDTLNRAFQLLSANPSADGIMSVTKTESNPSNSSQLRPDGTFRGFIGPEFIPSNRQETPNYYKITGSVVISRWNAFRRSETFMHDTTISLVVDPIEGIDIDNSIDFLLAEALIKKNLNSSQDVDSYLKL
jgi:CMP-N-acetylneuraminic acid synthetase